VHLFSPSRWRRRLVGLVAFIALAGLAWSWGGGGVIPDSPIRAPVQSPVASKSRP